MIEIILGTIVGYILGSIIFEAVKYLIKKIRKKKITETDKYFIL